MRLFSHGLFQHCNFTSTKQKMYDYLILFASIFYKLVQRSEKEITSWLTKYRLSTRKTKNSKKITYLSLTATADGHSLLQFHTISVFRADDRFVQTLQQDCQFLPTSNKNLHLTVTLEVQYQQPSINKIVTLLLKLSEHSITILRAVYDKNIQRKQLRYNISLV